MNLKTKGNGEPMRVRATFLTLGTLPILFAGCEKAPERHVNSPFAAFLRLDGVTIVDPRDGGLTPAMSIVMEQGRIVTIAPTSEIAAMPTMRSVNASGKFVVPGYNNMHVHVLDQPNASALLALMLSEGVTGFRQMSGSPDLLAQRREGTLPVGNDTPELLTMPGNVLSPLNAGSVEQMQAEVHQQKRDGADFIKVGILSPSVFFSATAAAAQANLPILGHLQEGVDPAQASQAGFRSVEHLGPGDTVWTGCSTNEAALLAEAAQHPLMRTPGFRIPAFVQKLATPLIQKRLINPAAFEDVGDVERLQRALNTYDEGKCRALAASFVANNTWHVPTLVRLRTQELADAPEYQTDPALQYMDPAAIKKWRDVTDRFRKLPPTSLATFREAYGRQLKLAKLLNQSGVRMMTGTDDGGQVPGQSLQQEFAELSKAGFTPLTILQMATINPAMFLERTDRMGTVEVGKNADLVVLDANPLLSIQSLDRIAAVVRDGRYLSAADLATLRSKVAAGHGYLPTR